MPVQSADRGSWSISDESQVQLVAVHGIEDLLSVAPFFRGQGRKNQLKIFFKYCIHDSFSIGDIPHFRLPYESPGGKGSLPNLASRDLVSIRFRSVFLSND